MESRRLVAAKVVASHLGHERACTWADLAARFGTSAVRCALRHGLVTQVLPGIYAETRCESDLRVRATAVTLWTGPTGLVTGLAAANLWRVVDEPPARITFQVPRAWHLRGPGWVRPLRIAAEMRPFRLGGVRLVSAPDAVVQSWREARPDVGAATVIAAVQRRVCTSSELVSALARRDRMPRRRLLEELVAVTGVEVTSYLEYVAWRDVFPPRLFPWLQWQVEMWPNRRKRVLDARDAAAKIDLEFDGGSTHGGVAGFERDRQRDADLRSIGYEPLHFTYRDLTERPEWCRRTYLELRAARLRRS